MHSGGPPPGKRYRFNSPPGWPTYPPEWIPPPGWQPDPSWPPAPPGWPFWSQIAPPEIKRRRPLIRVVQVSVAVVSFIGTVVGLVAAIQNWPKGVTESDWAKKANQTCEKYVGDILDPVLTAYPQMAQALQSLQAGNANSDQFSQISQQLGRVSSGFLKLTAELEGIDAPKNNQDITDLLKTGRDISAEFGTLANVMNKAAANQAALSDYTSADEAMAQWGSVSSPQWARLSVALHADQCTRFSPTSNGTPTPVPLSPTPVAPSPVPAQLTGAELALVSRIRTQALTSCAPPTGSLPAGVVAVNCRAVISGTTKLPLVMQFPDASSMNSWLLSTWESTVTPRAGGVCAEGGYDQQWASSTTNQRVGQLVCKQTATNDFTMVWTFDTAAVVVVADGADGPSLYQWWQNNGNLIVSP